MDAFLTAFLGDLASRSLSLLIDKYSKNAELTKEEKLDSLQRLLLRVRVVVEEAGERHITNQAMLQQLSTLRKEMYRAYYTPDTYRCQGHKDDGDDQQVSRTFALSRFNTAKRILLSGDGASKSQGINELKKVLWSLETAISDANECIVFLSSCPRLCRQPYNMHLILEKCMFGRQMELQHVVSFLRQTGRHGDEEPSVLPIIGPRRVGKSTLVEHAWSRRWELWIARPAGSWGATPSGANGAGRKRWEGHGDSIHARPSASLSPHGLRQPTAAALWLDSSPSPATALSMGAPALLRQQRRRCGRARLEAAAARPRPARYLVAGGRDEIFAKEPGLDISGS